MSSLQWRSSGMTTPPAPQLTRRNGVGVVLLDGMRAGNDQPSQYTLLQQQAKGGLRRGHVRHNVNN